MNTRRQIINLISKGNQFYNLYYLWNKYEDIIQNNIMFKYDGNNFYYDSVESESIRVEKWLAKILGLSVKQLRIELANRCNKINN